MSSQTPKLLMALVFLMFITLLGCLLLLWQLQERLSEQVTASLQLQQRIAATEKQNFELLTELSKLEHQISARVGDSSRMTMQGFSTQQEIVNDLAKNVNLLAEQQTKIAESHKETQKTVDELVDFANEYPQQQADQQKKLEEQLATIDKSLKNAIQQHQQFIFLWNEFRRGYDEFYEVVTRRLDDIAPQSQDADGN